MQMGLTLGAMMGREDSIERPIAKKERGDCLVYIADGDETP